MNAQESPKDYYVYSYTEPGKIDPFYIGKGKNNRLYQHLLSGHLKKKTRFYNKLRKLLSEGKHPIIKKDLSEKEALDLEKQLIAKYGCLDLGTGCLCNHNVLNHTGKKIGQVRSEETKRKISE